MKRVAVVTGSAGGIGGATCDAFRAAGWTVCGFDRAGVANPVDISDEAVSASAFAAVEREHGRIDALVNNAAVQIVKPLVSMSTVEWRELEATNSFAPYLAIRHAHRALRVASGAIVNVSSVHAIASAAGFAAYAASKGALSALTRALALELAADGIRVNAVLPGAVDTAMLRAGLRPANEANANDNPLAELAARTPLGRVGTPQEIACAILFLADAERSSFITGQSLVVDGGATAKLSTG